MSITEITELRIHEVHNTNGEMNHLSLACSMH